MILFNVVFALRVRKHILLFRFPLILDLDLIWLIILIFVSCDGKMKPDDCSWGMMCVNLCGYWMNGTGMNLTDNILVYSYLWMRGHSDGAGPDSFEWLIMPVKNVLSVPTVSSYNAESHCTY